MCFTSAAPEFLIYIPIIIVIALEVLNGIFAYRSSWFSLLNIIMPLTGPLIIIGCFRLLFFNRVIRNRKFLGSRYSFDLKRRHRHAFFDIVVFSNLKLNSLFIFITSCDKTYNICKGSHRLILSTRTFFCFECINIIL